MINNHYGPFSNLLPICLASGSPRRKLFLQNLGIDFTVTSPPDPEPLPENGEDPAAFAARSARAKGLAVAEIYHGSMPVIISADTVVAVDGLILGKPRNPEHGLEMLRMLSGRWHTVVSACLVIIFNEDAKGPQSPGRIGGLSGGCRPPLPLPGGGKAPENMEQADANCGLCRELAIYEETGVRFWDVPEAALAAYAFSAEPADKAGGYAVTGAGAFMVDAVNGSINNVVGLPLTSLARVLLEEKVIETVAGFDVAAPTNYFR